MPRLMLATLLLALLLPQDPPAPLQPKVVVPWASETVHLGTGRTVTGQVLKETEEALFLDLGFDVLRVPLSAITRRERIEDQVASTTTIDEGVFFRGERPERTVEEGAAEVGEAVVKIESPAGQGSGFITSPDGHIVTNFHVVKGEVDATVTLYLRSTNGFDLRTVRNVKVVAINPENDLALLQMAAPDGVKLKHVFVGASEKVVVGQRVFAIGTPIGLERTVSSGIISVTNRPFGGRVHFQTTTPINPGNSGGPLFNLRGEVVGVNTSGYVGLQGLNFAIPSQHVVDFLRNREAFALDTTRSEHGVHYLPAPRKPK